MSPDTFGMLLQSALHGSVDGLTAGPPCRTMSVLRMKEDGGPRQVRDKFGVGRFGKEGLSPAEQAVVDHDTVLFLRTFLLMAVIQASSHVLEKPKPLFFLEQPAAPSDYAPESDNHVRCPSLWAWPEAERIWALIGGWLATSIKGRWVMFAKSLLLPLCRLGNCTKPFCVCSPIAICFSCRPMSLGLSNLG